MFQSIEGYLKNGMRKMMFDFVGIVAIPKAFGTVKSTYPDAEKHAVARIDCFWQSGADL